MDQNNQPKNDKAMMDQAALLSFVENLIKDRKDPNIKPENISSIRALLLKQVNEAINTHMITLLQEKDQLELDDLLNKNATDDQLNEFFAKKIPNLEVEIASALLNFRSAYLYPVTQAVDLKSVSSMSPPPPPPAPVPPSTDDFNKKLN